MVTRIRLEHMREVWQAGCMTAGARGLCQLKAGRRRCRRQRHKLLVSEEPERTTLKAVFRINFRFCPVDDASSLHLPRRRVDFV